MLSKALNLAELWGYRPNHSNPCLPIKKYGENKRERFLSQDKIGRLMVVLAEEEAHNSSNPWPIHAIHLLLLTGCRLNEILALKWEEVDLDNNCLRLRDSKTGKKLVYLSSAAIELFNPAQKAIFLLFVAARRAPILSICKNLGEGFALTLDWRMSGFMI